MEVILRMPAEKVEKNLTDEMRVQLRKNARLAAEENFLCNVGEEGYPDDVWAALSAVGVNYAPAENSVRGIIVMDEFASMNASYLLSCMEHYADNIYAKYLSAIGVYLAGQ